MNFKDFAGFFGNVGGGRCHFLQREEGGVLISERGCVIVRL